MRVSEANTGVVKLEIEGNRDELELLVEALDTKGGRKPAEHRQVLDEFRKSLMTILSISEPMPPEG